MTINWIKVTDREPRQRQLVMVTGPSGYVTHKKFLALAWIDDEFRPRGGGRGGERPNPRWQSVVCDALSDQGWYPTHWAEQIDLPDIPLIQTPSRAMSCRSPNDE